MRRPYLRLRDVVARSGLVPIGVFVSLLVGGACSHPANPGQTGAGGSGNDNGGQGGNGNGPAIGVGGRVGEVEIDAGSGTDGGVISGTGGAVAVACADDPTQQQALPYATGYAIPPAAVTQAMTAVQSMTAAQKANQLRGTSLGQYDDIFRSAHSRADTTYNDTGRVKEFQFSDGPRGVNLDAVKPTGSQGYSTVFPAASGRGATFDVDLEYEIGVAMGDELIAAGRTMMLAPTVNILRHPAWGRSEETYGEDSFLLGRLGSAYVAGVQTYAPACAKHYAANNIERNRDSGAVAQMDEQTLQEVYARHFGMIIRDGGVSCIMAAYNQMQIGSGSPTNCTQSSHLLTDILRTEFRFQGMVMSDWWAMPGGRMPSTSVESTQARTALLAGLDMEMPWSLNYSQLEALNDDNSITTAALRVVREKFRFNVAGTTGQIGLKRPTTSVNGSSSITNNDAHIALALKAAVEGTVLLKNANNTLPIKTDGTIRRVAVVGLQVPWTLTGIAASGSVNFPVDARIGDLGSSRVNLDPGRAIGPYAGIMAAAPAAVSVLPGHDLAAAQGADFVVVVAGLTPRDEGEDYTITPDDSDRGASLALDGKAGTNAQNNFIAQVAALNKPMVVVLEGGSVIDTSAWDAMVPALVMAWYPGQSGGAALGQLLFGQANFSGKLPVTWPRALADEPRFSGSDAAPTSLTTPMGYYLGYRWFDTQGKTPLYAFGSGLSYAKFEYSNLTVPCSTVTKKGVVNVTVDIRNSGTVAGDEIAFLFVSWPSSAVNTRKPAAYKELKGFRRVQLNAGATKRITIPIRVSDLDYWNTTSNSWQIESGPVKVMVGPAADKLNLLPAGTFTVQ
jgi:beta-glucosidase